VNDAPKCRRNAVVFCFATRAEKGNGRSGSATSCLTDTSSTVLFSPLHAARAARLFSAENSRRRRRRASHTPIRGGASRVARSALRTFDDMLPSAPVSRGGYQREGTRARGRVERI